MQRLPPDFLARLGSLDQKTIAAKWAAAMSMPEHTHSVSGEKIEDGWTESEALELLRRLAALAREGTAGQEMYLLIEA